MSGAVFYIAKVEQNPLPVAFKLVSCDSNGFSFANDLHDFPRRIDYHYIDTNTMRVNVSGPTGAGFRVHYQRQPAATGQP